MNLGRSLMILGAVLVVAGALIQFAPALRLGRLPGDFAFGSGNVRVYVPLATSILASVVLTLLASIFLRR